MDTVLGPPADYLRKIWELRYFWFSLVKNDLGSRYRRSFLGIGWSLARPLGMTVVLCLVFSRIFNMSVVDYASYLLLGITLWQFITESINQGCGCFTRAGAYIRQKQIPLAIFPLRTVLAAGFHAVVAFSLAMVLTWIFIGVSNPIVLFSLIPSLALLFLLGWFLAMLAGLFHTHFPDTQHMLEIVLQIMFYLTPIIYRPETVSDRARLSWIVELNPLTSVLELFRNPILEGTLPSLYAVQMSLAFVAVIGFLAVLTLRKFERTLVFWI